MKRLAEALDEGKFDKYLSLAAESFILVLRDLIILGFIVETIWQVCLLANLKFMTTLFVTGIGLATIYFCYEIRKKL